MVRSIICLVADSVIRDAETQLVSVFNILEGITSEGFPLVIPKLTFFSLWGRDEGDARQFTARFTINLDGTELKSLEVPINFSDKVRNRNFVAIHGLLIPRPGSIVFSLKIPEVEQMAQYIIEINVASPARTEVVSTPQ